MSTSNQNIEELYIREKKKSTLLAVTTGVFALLFMLSTTLGWGGATATTSAGLSASNSARGSGAGDRGGVEHFFNEDGTINQEAVDAILERLSQSGGDNSLFKDRITGQLEVATDGNTITDAQAQELEKALGL